MELHQNTGLALGLTFPLAFVLAVIIELFRAPKSRCPYCYRESRKNVCPFCGQS